MRSEPCNPRGEAYRPDRDAKPRAGWAEPRSLATSVYASFTSSSLSIPIPSSIPSGPLASGYARPLRGETDGMGMEVIT